MIKTLLILGLVVLIMADEHYQSSWPPREHIAECQKKTGATDTDIEDLKHWRVPHSESSECFYGCIFQKVHFLKDDHSINEHEMEELIERTKQSKNPKYEKSKEKFIHMLEICPSEVNKHTPDHDDPRASCIAAKNLVECFAKSH